MVSLPTRYIHQVAWVTIGSAHGNASDPIKRNHSDTPALSATDFTLDAFNSITPLATSQRCSSSPSSAASANLSRRSRQTFLLIRSTPYQEFNSHHSTKAKPRQATASIRCNRASSSLLSGGGGGGGGGFTINIPIYGYPPTNDTTPQNTPPENLDPPANDDGEPGANVTLENIPGGGSSAPSTFNPGVPLVNAAALVAAVALFAVAPEVPLAAAALDALETGAAAVRLGRIVNAMESNEGASGTPQQLPQQPGNGSFTQNSPESNDDPEAEDTGRELKKLGYNVVQLDDFQPPPPGGGNPDLDVSGLGIVDVYSPKKASSLDNVIQTIANKGRQAQTVVVRGDFSTTEQQEIANRLFGKTESTAQNVMKIIFQSSNDVFTFIARR